MATRREQYVRHCTWLRRYVDYEAAKAAKHQLQALRQAQNLLLYHNLHWPVQHHLGKLLSVGFDRALTRILATHFVSTVRVPHWVREKLWNTIRSWEASCQRPLAVSEDEYELRIFD